MAFKLVFGNGTVSWAYCGRVRVSVRVKGRPKSHGQASDCGRRKYNFFIESLERKFIRRKNECFE